MLKTAVTSWSRNVTRTTVYEELLGGSRISDYGDDSYIPDGTLTYLKIDDWNDE